MADEVPWDLKGDYERWLPAMMSLLKDDLLPLNMSASGAVERCLGRLPRLRRLEPELVAQFGDEPSERIVALEQQAHALLHAELACKSEKKPNLRALSERVLFYRERLWLGARVFAAFGRMDPKRLARIPSPLGYRRQIDGVLGLIGLLTEALDQDPTGTTITRDDLTDAGRAAWALLDADAYQRAHRGRPTPAQEMRVRAFTLLAGTYDLLRRDVAWLRWRRGDLDEVLPALNTNKGRRRKRAEPKAE